MEVQLIGGPELARMLRNLPLQTRRKVCREASKAALDPLVAEMRAAAPVKTGALRRAIRRWFSLRKSGEARAGIVVSDRRSDTAAYAETGRMPPSAYAWWVEAGHGWGQRPKRKMRQGQRMVVDDPRRRTRAYEFVGGPWRAAESRTLALFMDTLRAGIERVWNRGG